MPGFGDLVRTHRSALRLTQAELAERAGISERAVSDIERGLRRHVYRDTALRLARALELAGAAATAFEAAARGRPLPVAATDLVGRDREVAELLAMLRDPQVREVTLTGPGGVGKTSVALEVASRRDSVFVPLGDVPDPELVLPAVAGALGVPARGDPVVSVATAVQGRPLLLVLDTLEHVLPAGPALAAVMARAPELTLLVTSRAPLNIRAERIYALEPLAPQAAGELFVRRLGSDVATPLALEICERVDRLPLAIELAASRASRLGSEAIRDHLDHRLQLLSGGPVDAPPRQRSLAATIAWSYDLLGSPERRLLEQLSVFAGGWTIAAAVAVVDIDGEVVGSLAQLVEASLVHRAAESRFSMLDTVREYAAERLQERGGDVRRRHAEHFLRVAEAGGEPVREEWDNLRAALSWSIASGENRLALRLAAALWMEWRARGAFAEGRAWMRRVLALDAAGCADIRARALWGAGWLAYQQGDYSETGALGSELLGWAETAGDPEARRNGLTLVALERMAAAEYATAAKLFDEALTLARQIGSAWLLATSLLNRGAAAEHGGDLALARSLLTEALDIYESLGDERFIPRVWVQLAYIALLEGDRRAATDLVLRGLEMALRVGDDWSIVEQLDAAVAVLAAAGRPEAARELAAAATAIWRGIGALPHPFDRRSTELWFPERVAASDIDSAAAAELARRSLEEMGRS